MKRLTCKVITKAFYKKHPKVKIKFWLIRGDGYFYLTSDDIEFYKKFKSTSIYTFKLFHMTLEQWVSSIEALCEEAELL